MESSSQSREAGAGLPRADAVCTVNSPGRLLPPALVSCSVTVQMAGTHLGAGTGGLLVLPEAWGMQVRPWEFVHRGEDHGVEGTSVALFLPAFPIGSWDTCEELGYLPCNTSQDSRGDGVGGEAQSQIVTVPFHARPMVSSKSCPFCT